MLGEYVIGIEGTVLGIVNGIVVDVSGGAVSIEDAGVVISVTVAGILVLYNFVSGDTIVVVVGTEEEAAVVKDGIVVVGTEIIVPGGSEVDAVIELVIDANVDIIGLTDLSVCAEKGVNKVENIDAFVVRIDVGDRIGRDVDFVEVIIVGTVDAF